MKPITSLFYHLTLFSLFLALPFLPLGIARADDQAVQLKVADGSVAVVPPLFVGLSYESAILLPKDGHYNVTTNDQALVTLFHTLGTVPMRNGLTGN